MFIGLHEASDDVRVEICTTVLFVKRINHNANVLHKKTTSTIRKLPEKNVSLQANSMLAFTT